MNLKLIAYENMSDYGAARETLKPECKCVCSYLF